MQRPDRSEYEIRAQQLRAEAFAQFFGLLRRAIGRVLRWTFARVLGGTWRRWAATPRARRARKLQAGANRAVA